MILIDRHTEREKEGKKKKKKEKGGRKKREYTASERVYRHYDAVYSSGMRNTWRTTFWQPLVYSIPKKKKREGESMQYTPKIEHSVYEFFSACGRLTSARAYRSSRYGAAA